MTAGIPASPWTAGRLGTRGRPRLLFGAMYEDSALDAEILRSCRRVFAIGAAGDTAMRLVGGARRVTAVDVNPAQVAYLRDRMRGAQRRRGAADRLVAAARRLAPATGWTPHRVEEFLRCSDVPSQLRYFDRRLVPQQPRRGGGARRGAGRAGRPAHAARGGRRRRCAVGDAGSLDDLGRGHRHGGA
jgi:S-adenosylmethionine:diacylglycerol 3-amino-3-carboxypropyl transferase